MFEDAPIELILERQALRRYRSQLSYHPDPRDPDFPGYEDDDEDDEDPTR